MAYRMFLDDERFPAEKDSDMIVVRSFEEAAEYMAKHGCPSFISFDHDLGQEKSGYDLAKAMVYLDMYSPLGFFPKGFSFYVHSQNPVGAKNIKSYLDGYLAINGPRWIPRQFKKVEI